MIKNIEIVGFLPPAFISSYIDFLRKNLKKGMKIYFLNIYMILG